MYTLLDLFFYISSAQTRTPIARVIWLTVGIIFLATLIFGFLVAFVFTGKRDVNRIKENSDFNVRIYTYDYAKNHFYCFDMVDMRNAKDFEEKDFYAQFSKTDRHLVKDWLNSIANNDNYSDFIQADVVLSKFKKIVCSMLEITSVNREKNIIHFYSHLLPNSYMSNMKTIAKAKNKIPGKYFINNVEEGQHFMNKTLIDYVGAAFYFKLYKNTPQLTDEEQAKLSKMNEEIVLILGRFLNKNKRIYKINEYEEMFIDSSSISKIAAITQAHIFKTHIQQYLNHADEKDEIHIAIGVSNGSCYRKDFFTAIEQSNKMAEAIIKGLTTEKVLFYDESFYTNYQLQKAQKDEVRMVIKNTTFRNYFTPTINISTGKQSFFMLKTSPYGTKVKDFYSVIMLAKKMHNKLDNLFVSLIQKCALMAKQHDGKTSIAIELPYSTLPEFVQAVNTVHNSYIDWILCFHEVDILTSKDEPTHVSKTFNKYNEQGFKIGIIIKNPSSGLRTRILTTISYFFVPPTFTSQSLDSNNLRTDLRNIQASYSPYKVPIVFYGLKDFDDIEFAVHYGGQIFQADELALPSSRIEIIEPEKMAEIMKETKNLRPHVNDEQQNIEL